MNKETIKKGLLGVVISSCSMVSVAEPELVLIESEVSVDWAARSLHNLSALPLVVPPSDLRALRERNEVILVISSELIEDAKRARWYIYEQYIVREGEGVSLGALLNNLGSVVFLPDTSLVVVTHYGDKKIYNFPLDSPPGDSDKTILKAGNVLIFNKK